jgi:hypothetical protein
VVVAILPITHAAQNRMTENSSEPPASKTTEQGNVKLIIPITCADKVRCSPTADIVNPSPANNRHIVSASRTSSDPNQNAVPPEAKVTKINIINRDVACAVADLARSPRRPNETINGS